MPPEPIPELIRLIFPGQPRPVFAAASERLLAWAAAFDDWTAWLKANRSPDIASRYHYAWVSFLRACPKVPWEVDERDLAAWVESLEAAKHAPGYVQRYLGGLSGFYKYCAEHLDAALGGGCDPFAAYQVPPQRPYERAVVLSLEQARSLLEAIDREASLLGVRDYALLLCYLLVGGKARNLRRLRWDDLRLEGGSASIVGPPPQPLPPVVWEAVSGWLEASGLRPVLQPGDYVFPVLADPLNTPPTGKPADWDRSRPVTVGLFWFNYNRYAHAAGVPTHRVSQRALRHSAVLIRLEAGADLDELAAFLGWHRDRAASYLVTLLEVASADPAMAPRAAPAQSDGPKPAINRSPHRSGTPGNQNHLKHGFYAARLPPEDFAGVDELPKDTLEDEIDVLRVVIRRTFAIFPSKPSILEACRMLEVLSNATARLARIMLAHRQLTGAQDDSMPEYLQKALAEVMEELRLANPEAFPNPE